MRTFQSGDHRVCESILRALPEWFGIESSLVQYVEDTRRYPTWLAEVSGEPAGFVTVHRHFPRAAEIHCIAALPAFHRAGVGRTMIEFVERHLQADGCQFLQVKTLDESRPCHAYDKTRLFYEAMGFTPLEVFPTLWPGNPALMMIKSL